MCSRENRGCHSSESSSCHGGASSCHESSRPCHGSEEVLCHEVTAPQDVTPVVVLTPQGPGAGQVPLAPAPCLQQQQQQIKQPVQWPPQQQHK